MTLRRLAALICVVALALTLGVGGCTQGDDSDGASSGETATLLRVSGSGTSRPLMNLCTDAYPVEEAEFSYLPGLHSGGGIQGVADGSLELGLTSRMLDAEEQALGLDHTILSDDGLAVAVHPTVEIDSLTTQQVVDVYAGEYANWTELGGADLPIVILDRNEDESAKIILRQYVIGDTLVTEDAVAMYYESDMVEGLESTPGAIGFFSLGYGISQDIEVTYVALDGVEPTVESIESGEYAAIRPLGYVTDPAAPQEVADFTAWATGPEAEELMRENGYAPHAE